MEGVRPLLLTGTGHGTRQMCGTNTYGFPIRHRTRRKRFFGFQTGDLVRAVVPAGLKTAGTHVGRVLVRASGRFDVVTATGRRVAGIGHRYVRPLARGDGYAYGYADAYADGYETRGTRETSGSTGGDGNGPDEPERGEH